nr:hypothetical protein [Bacilli bacterium]
IGLIISTIIYGNNMPMELLTKFTYMILPYSNQDVMIFVNNYGMQKLLIATIGYGVANSLNHMLFYILLNRSIKLFKSITIGDIFTKTAADIATEMISISFMAAFIMPIMLHIITNTTSLFKDLYFKVGYGALFFLGFSLVMKIVIERGMVIAKQNTKYDRAIDDYKADIDELKIQSIKREAELKNLKKMVKEENAKVEETTKKRKHHHSRAKNKGTTKE